MKTYTLYLNGFGEKQLSAASHSESPKGGSFRLHDCDGGVIGEFNVIQLAGWSVSQVSFLEERIMALSAHIDQQQGAVEGYPSVDTRQTSNLTS